MQLANFLLSAPRVDLKHRHGLKVCRQLGDLQDDDWPKLTSTANVLMGAKLYVNDQAGMTVARIRSIARQCRRCEGLYIQMISAESSSNCTPEVGKISTALKNLAKEPKIPVIVFAQLNRGSTNRPDKRPLPSDIHDSGQIEQDADVVVLVHRDMKSEEGQNGVTELIVGKVRHARVGSCMVQQQEASTPQLNAPPTFD